MPAPAVVISDERSYRLAFIPKRLKLSAVVIPPMPAPTTIIWFDFSSIWVLENVLQNVTSHLCGLFRVARDFLEPLASLLQLVSHLVFSMRLAHQSFHNNRIRLHRSYAMLHQFWILTFFAYLEFLALELGQFLR